MAEKANENGAAITFFAKASAFLKGLSLMQPLQVCLLGSSFAMKRFGYGPKEVSPFVGLCSNSMELFYLISALGTFVVSSWMKNKNGNRSFPAKGCLVSSWLIVLANIMLLRSYSHGEGNENITMYYWMLVIANFIAGIDDMFMFDVASDKIASYDLGASFTGLVVVAFHWCTMTALEKRNMDVNYWLIVCQLYGVLGLSALAAAMWTGYTYAGGLLDKGSGGETQQTTETSGANSDNSTFFEAYWAALPMCAASTIGYGFIYVVYPLISPFEMVKFEHQYPIQRACLIFHALSGITVWLMDQFGGLSKKWEGENAKYHYIWYLGIPFLGIGCMFIWIMHNPNSGLAGLIRMRPAVVGFLTVVYYYSGRMAIISACVGIDGNARKSNGTHSSNSNGHSKHGSTISAMNLGINLLALSLSKYVSEAYIQQFRDAREAFEAGVPWPTDGMSTSSAFGYWLKTGIKEGYRNITEVMVKDVRTRL
ncbi:TPR-related protein family member, putative [Babesia caballi]|uniref:TPR-related protein family member, putative n=1 Tax=Babesia caballi TaxID=5871 RepID=A0AAV4LVJ6_BABCB|nr:TPR-related protein family member, putative [Babesia caballi]